MAVHAPFDQAIMQQSDTVLSAVDKIRQLGMNLSEYAKTQGISLPIGENLEKIEF